VRRLVLASVCFWAIIGAPLVSGQNASAQNPKSVWDGVYTSEQATRGKAAFEANCLACHGVDLSGGTGPDLVGSRFMNKWDYQSLNQLYTEMKTRMPRSNPGSLSDETYLDIVTYILRANSLPTGASALKAEAKDLPTGTLAQVVGCLSAGPDGAWILASASAPVRTTDPEPSKGERRQAAESGPLGNLKFQLLGIYTDLDSQKGHKMEAKGFLVRDAGGDRLNIVALEMLGANCLP
jgi:mono/diheme cytochrome c family protein